MENEDISDIVNFISIQEKVKHSKSTLNEKKKNNQDKEDDDDNGKNINGDNLLYPVDTSTPSPSSLESEPTKDVIKRRLTALQAPKAEKSSLGQPSSFSASLSPTALVNMGYGSNTIQNVRSRTPTAVPNQPSSNLLRSMISTGMQRMPIAASYDPFSSNKEEISENTKLIRQKVLNLLKKEPHKTEINKMRSEISGE